METFLHLTHGKRPYEAPSVMVPYLEFTQVNAAPDAADEVEALLTQAIPLLWQHGGLLDCKVMKNARDQQWLLLCSWKSEACAQTCIEGADWQQYDCQWKALVKQGKMTTKKLIHAPFETVE